MKKYYLAGKLVIHERDSLDSAQAYCIFVAGRTFYGTRQIASLLLAVEASPHPAQIAQAYNARMGSTLGEADIRSILEKQLMPNGVVVQQGEHVQPAIPTKSPFFFSCPMLKQAQVLALSKRLTCLYASWRPLGLVLGALVLLALWYGHLTAAGEDLFSISKLLPLSAAEICLYVILVLSAFICHELGHAAAAQRYDCTPAEIGIGLYLIFPAVFCNVTEIWRLPRLARVVVNLGGCYFQLLLTAVLTAIQLYTRSDVLSLVIATSLLAMLMTLNPFLRFDGYWVYADWFGLPNLRLQSQRCMQSMSLKVLSLLMRVPAQPMARVPLALYCYSAGSVLFFGYFAVYLLRQADSALSFLGTLPVLLASMADTGSSLETILAVSGKALFSMLVVLGLLFVLSLLTRTMVRTALAWRTTRHP